MVGEVFESHRSWFAVLSGKKARYVSLYDCVCNNSRPNACQVTRAGSLLGSLHKHGSPIRRYRLSFPFTSPSPNTHSSSAIKCFTSVPCLDRTRNPTRILFTNSAVRKRTSSDNIHCVLSVLSCNFVDMFIPGTSTPDDRASSSSRNMFTFGKRLRITEAGSTECLAHSTYGFFLYNHVG